MQDQGILTTNALIQVLRFLFPRLTVFTCIYSHVNQTTNIQANPNTNSIIDISLNTNTLTGTNTHSNTNGKTCYIVI